MRQASHILAIDGTGSGLTDITAPIVRWSEAQDMREGLLTIFCRHTSASLIITENAAHAVRHDIEAYFARIAPEDANAYVHDDEGPDDMPAHLRTALTGVNLSVPLIDGTLTLGTWQGIFLFEHRRRPHRRSIALHLMGA
ncbi:secondary thiamine-phosphate synthase enzyme YjbQ [uncultured Sphingomonas sp.]|uniref:secondary thiamine-phosphate synthase enzyme YjbQ n=1 Tax=uncultured Sphingomonas sp. TaxID=158754 RepID=UPI0035CA469A